MELSVIGFWAVKRSEKRSYSGSRQNSARSIRDTPFKLPTSP